MFFLVSRHMLQSSLILYIVFKTRILPKSAVYFSCQNREILVGRVTLVESFRPNSHTHTHHTYYTRSCQIDRWCGIYYYYYDSSLVGVGDALYFAHATLRQQFKSIILYYNIVVPTNTKHDEGSFRTLSVSIFYCLRSSCQYNHRKPKNRNFIIGHISMCNAKI